MRSEEKRKAFNLRIKNEKKVSLERTQSAEKRRERDDSILSIA